MTRKQRFQDILDDAGMHHIQVIDKDNVSTFVDGEKTTFSRSDRYSGHPLSGFAYFGNVSGDHRMIQDIAENIRYAFSLMI